MVERNKDTAIAWLQRYLYRRAFQRTGDDAADKQTADQDLDRALELADREHGPANTEVWLAASGREADRGDNGKALELAQRAIDEAPEDYRGYLYLGNLQLRQNGPEGRGDVITLWQKTLDKPGIAKIPISLPLAELLTAINRGQEAEELLSKLTNDLLQLRESDRNRARIKIAVLRAKAKAVGGDPHDAIAILSGAVNAARGRASAGVRDATLAEAWATLGALYSADGEFDQAAAAYRNAARSGFNSEQIGMALARVYQLSGRTDDAVARNARFRHAQ